MPTTVPPGTLGQRLKRAREKAGLTQRGLARLAGTRGPTIYRIETDRQGTSATLLRRIADALATASRQPVGKILDELTRDE